jgi:hypothetical protein
MGMAKNKKIDLKSFLQPYSGRIGIGKACQDGLKPALDDKSVVRSGNVTNVRYLQESVND